MGSNLIIIRGNSCSGKTTVAKKLQQKLGDGTMLVSQDVLRREILKVKDGPGNPSIELLYETVMYGSRIGYDVILEGILVKKFYGEMLQALVRDFAGTTYAYYFDLPFGETLKRHGTKSNAQGYGEAELKQWWSEKDHLGLAWEKSFSANQSEAQIIRAILRDVGSDLRSYRQK